ncbi:hypothetical protein [Saccharopolyspora soli]|nr:hypothetical protein [Saccharopolyspora soli]
MTTAAALTAAVDTDVIPALWRIVTKSTYRTKPDVAQLQLR